MLKLVLLVVLTSGILANRMGFATHFPGKVNFTCLAQSKTQNYFKRLWVNGSNSDTSIEEARSLAYKQGIDIYGIFPMCPRCLASWNHARIVHRMLEIGRGFRIILEIVEYDKWSSNQTENVEWIQQLRLELSRNYKHLHAIMATRTAWEKFIGNTTFPAAVQAIYHGDSQNNFDDYPQNGLSPAFRPFAKVVNKDTKLCGVGGLSFYVGGIPF